MPALHLAIENFDNLPDGGPVTIDVRGRRGLDIGRDPYLDWTLPDPDRFVSGKHCEIRFRDGAYWLVDMSSNGTFVNGAEGRLTEPYRLRTGDRIEIGPYIIAATVEDDAPAQADAGPEASAGGDVYAAEAAPASAADDDLWGVSAEVADPVSPRSLQPPGKAAGAVKADFLEWQMDLHDIAERPDEPPATQASSSPSPLPPPLLPPQPSPPIPPASLPSSPRPLSPGGDDGGLPLVEPPGTASPTDRTGYPQLARATAPPSATAEPGRSDIPAHDPAPTRPEPPAGSPTEQSATPLSPERWDPELAQSRMADASFGDAPMVDDGATPPSTPTAPVAAVLPPSAQLAASQAPSRDALHDFLDALAAEMGVPAASLHDEDPAEIARRIGLFMVQSVAGLQQLLRARSEARGVARTRGQTVVQAVGNNPLKFLPNPDDVLKILFGPRTNSYLDIEESLGTGFRDLASHQVATYAAMQRALTTLLKDLEPAAIEKKLGSDSGLGSIMSSRRGRLWDEYRDVWETRSALYGDSMLDTFMMYFGQFYQDQRDEDDTRP